MKKLALILGLIAVVVAIPVGVVLVKQRQDMSSKASPATTLAVSPANATKDVDESFSVAVNINTGGNTVIGSDIVLSFNPQVLEATAITTGTFFDAPQEIQKSINNTTGKIIYSAYVSNTSAKTGQGTVITIAFKGKAAGTSQLTFDSQSDIRSIEDEVNVLTSSTPGSYTIGAGGSPSGSPTSSPTGSPTASPSVSPSGSSSPTPTGTQAGGVVFSPTPTARPSTSPTPTSTSQSSSSTVTITSVASGASINNLKPTFSGKAPANSQVTITVRSNPITGTVTADAAGNWSWTPPSSLDLGSHSATVVATSPSGQTSQTVVNFTVAGNVPSSGVGEYTIILMILGFAGLVGAFLLSL